MSWGYILNRNSNNLFDYKEHFFFRSDESLYVVEIKENEVYEVVDVFFNEHLKFFEKLAERFSESFYTKDEILHDFKVILYEYLYEKRKEINPFLEYHKSMIFLHIKREMSKKFYERKSEYNYEQLDISEEKDINYVYQNRTEEIYSGNYYDFSESSFEDSESIVHDFAVDASFDLKRVIRDIVDEKSLLFFVLNFCSNKKKLCSFHLELAYEISPVYSKKIYQKIKLYLKRKFFLNKSSSKKKTLLDYFSQYSEIFDKKLIVIDGYYFHSRISFINDVDALYNWELNFLKKISSSQEYNLDYFLKRKRVSLKFLNFLYNCYRQIYNPIGYYFTYFPEKNSFILSYHSPLVESEFDSISINRFYKLKIGLFYE